MNSEALEGKGKSKVVFFKSFASPFEWSFMLSINHKVTCAKRLFHIIIEIVQTRITPGEIDKSDHRKTFY